MASLSPSLQSLSHIEPVQHHVARRKAHGLSRGVQYGCMALALLGISALPLPAEPNEAVAHAANEVTPSHLLGDAMGQGSTTVSSTEKDEVAVRVGSSGALLLTLVGVLAILRRRQS